MKLVWKELSWEEVFGRTFRVPHCRINDRILKIDVTLAVDPQGTGEQRIWFALLYLLTPNGWAELKSLPLNLEGHHITVQALKDYAQLLYGEPDAKAKSVSFKRPGAFLREDERPVAEVSVDDQALAALRAKCMAEMKANKPKLRQHQAIEVESDSADVARAIADELQALDWSAVVNPNQSGATIRILWRDPELA